MCQKPRCKCCKLVTNSTKARVTIKGRRKIIRTGKGTCTTRNVIYLAVCKCCRKYYIGKTIQELHARTNQHRSSFLKYAKSRGKMAIQNKDMDTYALGIHLYDEHKLDKMTDFDNAYEIHILEVCSPRILDMREHMLIHKYEALAPYGLNLGHTFGLPLLS